MFSTPIFSTTRESYTREFVYDFTHPYCPEHPNPFFDGSYEEKETGLKFNYSEVNFADHLWNAHERGIDETLAKTLLNEAGYYEATPI